MLARDRRTFALPLIGLGLAVLLITFAIALPRWTDWHVVSGWPPLRARWDPRVGLGTLLAAGVGASGLLFGPRLARALPWRWLLAATWAGGVVWMLALDLVDGWDGLKHLFHLSNEYFRTARATDDIGFTLSHYVDRIPLHSSDHWPVHLSAHPPGALLFFVLLARIGLRDPVLVGLVVALVAATTPVAVLVTLRTLRAEAAARLAAPFLVLCPAALYWGLIADGAYAAAAAWSLALLARAAVARSLAWSVAAGVALGCCCFLSYGLVLLAVLAFGVLVAARSWYPLVPALGAVLAVAVAFAVLGFSWWDAYPVLRQRYFDGVGGERPASYWLWANLAALSISAGPLLLAGVATTLGRLRQLLAQPTTRSVAILIGAAASSVALADLSLLSKAEVERIWLPFLPWLLIGCALLPDRWRRPGLALQVVFALLVQNLLFVHR